MPALRALAVLLSFQLLGELIGRLTLVPVPGPVVGLVLMATWLIAQTRISKRRPLIADPAADGLLANLGILFVPAGVGVIAQLDSLGTHWAGITFVLIVSTVVTMLATVGTFLMVLKLVGHTR